MTLTHWFLLFGGLTILAIAIDGIRRMVSKPTTLAIDLDETLQNLVQEDYGAELPNGGARVVGADVVAPVVATTAATVAAEETVEQVVEQVVEPVVAEFEVEEIIEDVAADVEQATVVAAVEKDLQVESLSIEAELDAEPELSLDDELAEEILLEGEVIEAVQDEVEEQPVELIEEEIVAAEPAPEFDLAAPEEVVADAEELEEANPLVAAFDPTRPVHEVVESHKMVQSDMFADMEVSVETEPEMADDWQEYAAIEEAVAEEVVAEIEETGELEAETEFEMVDEEPLAFGEEPSACDEEPSAVGKEPSAVGKESSAVEEEPSAFDETAEFDSEWQAASAKADDILLTDTGLDDDEPQGQSPFAKVTSFFAGRKMLEMRRKQEQDAQALEELTQAEDSVVANVEQVLTIIVAAKDTQGFYGHNLKTLAEACGMVHGSMGLFHRHEDGLTEGSTQFSMANMTESGAFDMDTIENIHTAGVVFFMTLPSANDSMRGFDYMVETAQCLANNLGGELYDDSRSVLRAQTVEHYRQRIREFERQRLARRAQGGI